MSHKILDKEYFKNIGFNERELCKYFATTKLSHTSEMREAYQWSIENKYDASKFSICSIIMSAIRDAEIEGDKKKLKKKLIVIAGMAKKMSRCIQANKGESSAKK